MAIVENVHWYFNDYCLNRVHRVLLTSNTYLCTVYMAPFFLFFEWLLLISEKLSCSFGIDFIGHTSKVHWVCFLNISISCEIHVRLMLLSLSVIVFTKSKFCCSLFRIYFILSESTLLANIRRKADVCIRTLSDRAKMEAKVKNNRKNNDEHQRRFSLSLDVNGPLQFLIDQRSKHWRHVYFFKTWQRVRYTFTTRFPWKQTDTYYWSCQV